MRGWIVLLAAGGLAGLVGCAGVAGSPVDAGGEAAGLPNDEERALIFATLALESDSDGRVRNDCGEPIEPGLETLDLGGELGRAVMLVLVAGPATPTCYGESGQDFTLLRRTEAGFKEVFTASGQLAVLPTRHGGVHDIAIGGPGDAFPVFEWNGEGYRRTRTIPELPLPPRP